MSKPKEAAAAARHMDDQGLPGRWLLDFLDRNLHQFSKGVRNTIGVTILAVLAIVVLHGAIAPTYVEGHLFITDSEAEPKQQARGYVLIRGNEPFLTNDNGYWMLPMRGFMPRKVHVQVYDGAGKRVDEFAFWGPVPVVSALWVPTYDVEVRTYLRAGDASRVQVASAGALGALTSSAARIAAMLDPFATLQAQPRAASWQVPYIKAHLENIGDVACRDGSWCGTRGESRRLEGFAVSLTERPGNLRIEYLCRSTGRASGVWLSEGEFCGTRGESRALEAFAVRLVGADAQRFTVAYQAYAQGGGESTVSRDGQLTTGAGSITAIRVWLDRR